VVDEGARCWQREPREREGIPACVREEVLEALAKRGLQSAGTVQEQSGTRRGWAMGFAVVTCLLVGLGAWWSWFAPARERGFDRANSLEGWNETTEGTESTEEDC
jgi:hypothetical protein